MDQMKKGNKKKRKNNFWKTSVTNQRWEIWGVCAMTIVMWVLLLYTAHNLVFPEPEHEFTLNTTTTNHLFTTCHHYNDRFFCCEPNPYIVEHKNQSTTATALYDCKAVQKTQLIEPYIIE